MANQKPKPYTITWPFTPKTAEDIDQTFDILFKQVQLNAPGAGGVLPVIFGGTGLGAFVKGDLLYASSVNTIDGLPDVAVGNVLLSGGIATAPLYGKVLLSGGTTHVSGVLPEANGGTAQSTYAQGDLLYASATDTLAKLAKNTTATRYLSNTGASNSPAWAQINLANGVTGTLPATNGGTGLNSYTTGDLLTAASGTTFGRINAVASGNALISAGVSTTPSWGKIGLTTHVSGVLAEANGGTNQSTYLQGDLLYASASNTLAKLAKDTNATRYLSNTGTSNAPAWAQVNVTNGVTGTLPVTSGGTGLNTVAQGDLLYGSASNTLSALAKDTNATRYLSNTGTSNNPAWAQINVANGVTGTLAATNGGTGHASFAVGDVLYASTTTALSRLAGVATGNALISGGVNTAPSWGKIADAHISDVTEAKITDGTILARLAANETITGDWTHSAAAPLIKFLETDQAANAQKWRIQADGGQLAIQVLSDNEITVNSPLIFVRSGSTISSVATGFTWNFASQPLFQAGALVPNTFGYFVENTAGTDIPIGQITSGNQLNIGSDSSAAMNNTVLAAGQSVIIRCQGADRVSFSPAGNVTPAVDNAQTCGNGTFRWSLVRGVTITPGDLLFDNGWAITEHDKYGISTPGLVIVDANDDMVAFIGEGGTIYANVRPLALIAHQKTTIEERTGRPREPRPTP